MNAHKPSFADLRLVCDYHRGLRNEIAVDLQAIEMAGLDPTRYGKIPRPSRWIGKLRRFAFVSRLLQYISLPVWYFVAPSLFARQCRAALAQQRPAEAVRFDPAGQVLAFSIRALEIVHPRHIDPAPRQWIEMHWLPLERLPGDAEVLPAMALLDEIDLRRSLTLAKLAHRALQLRRGTFGWGLQSYTAWRWFIARLTVDKLPGPLLTVDHFDRWAVLVDGSAAHSRSRGQPRHLTVIQHGSVNADVSPIGLGLRLPTKLRAVNHLRAYSEADVTVFKEEILSRRCGICLEASFYRPSVTLIPIAVPEGPPALLFVGHPLCETAHCALLAALRRHGDWQLFYKPHPANRASAVIATLPWTVIEGRSVFPRVDLLISYPSTMVSEYAAHGIPAVVHRMDVSAAQLLDRLPEILQAIQSRRSSAAPSTSSVPAAPLSSLLQQ